MKQNLNLLISFPLSFISSILFFKIYLFLSIDFEFIFEDFESITFFFKYVFGGFMIGFYFMFSFLYLSNYGKRSSNYKKETLFNKTLFIIYTYAVLLVLVTLSTHGILITNDDNIYNTGALFKNLLLYNRNYFLYPFLGMIAGMIFYIKNYKSIKSNYLRMSKLKLNYLIKKRLNN